MAGELFETAKPGEILLHSRPRLKVGVFKDFSTDDAGDSWSSYSLKPGGSNSSEALRALRWLGVPLGAGDDVITGGGASGASEPSSHADVGFRQRARLSDGGDLAR